MAQPQHIQPLANVEGRTIEELKTEVSNGGRFIVYQYTISLLAVTLRRMTAAHFIPAEQSPDAFKKTPNTLSLIFGWWCIPWGPIRTLQSLKVNNGGGIDVTRDVMINLTPEDLAKSQVLLQYAATTVIAPNKNDTKELLKVIHQFMEAEPEINEVYYGLYVNTSDPYFVFGFSSGNVVADLTDELKTILHKYFYKHTRFYIADINDGSAMTKELLELNLKVTRP